MGKKYIIEIEEGKEGVMFCQSGIVSIGLHLEDEESLRGLGIKSAIPYTEPDMEKVREEAYQQGLSDAKEGKATCQYCEYQYLDDTEEPCKKCCKAYMNKYKPKAKEEQIQVGDEVVVDSGKCVVLAVDKDGFPAKLLEPDGYTLTLTTDVKLPKTGRHYPQIAEVLAKMKEES